MQNMEIQMKNKGILIVVSGFSGAGKGTLMTRLIEKYDTYALSVSMTTREARDGEIDGINYFFLEKEEFEEKIKENALVEYANYCGNYYGTPREYVEQQLQLGKDVILEIEIQGALKIKQNFPNALLLFVMPPDVAELKKRLVGRGTETLDVIEKRLMRAKEESAGIEEYDYIVINDDLEQCVDEVNEIVRAAHNTPARNVEFIEKTKKDLERLSEGE